jgi:ribosomal protein S12 methylthiotransferase
MYSQEEGTPAAEFKKQIPQKEKRERFDEIMKIQKEIALNLNRRFLGSEMNCLIEEKQEDVYIGRTYADAPDVDGVVYVQGRADMGQFVKCRIVDTMEYDLIAENYANTGLPYKNGTHI